MRSRLYKVFINVPWWYLSFYTILSPFMTQRTKSKFVFAGPVRSAETLLKSDFANLFVDFQCLRLKEDQEEGKMLRVVRIKVFINVPWWYLSFYTILSPFMTQRTKSKFVFAGPVRSDETLLKELELKFVFKFHYVVPILTSCRSDFANLFVDFQCLRLKEDQEEGKMLRVVRIKVFINVPWWYLSFYTILSPFMTQRTKSKFVFAGPIRSAETLLKIFNDIFDMDHLIGSMKDDIVIIRDIPAWNYSLASPVQWRYTRNLALLVQGSSST